MFISKYGAVLDKNITSTMNGLNFGGCLTAGQRAAGREPYSTIKTVLFEHMQKNHPEYAVYNDPRNLDQTNQNF
jgi:hypothetical protein